MMKLNSTRFLDQYNNPEYSMDFATFLSKISSDISNREGHQMKKLAKSATIQVTDGCNLRCSYCYQINKGNKFIPIETGKKFIDLLLGDSEKNHYFYKGNVDSIVMDFIGGEPLLAIDQMSVLADYFVQRLIELDHPWLQYYMFSMSTNGTLYFDSKVQDFINKHDGRLSIGVTVDGNKTLHDSCRVFPDGSGSYDKAIAAVMDWRERGHDAHPGTKLTIAPGNLKYLADANKHMIDLGFTRINENCVYENVWKPEHATLLYKQLKETADYILNNNLEKERSLRIFDLTWYHPMPEDNNNNWCGGDGSMVAVNPYGNIYNCLRFMESSIGNSRAPLIIGNVDRGIGITEQDKKNIHEMQCITRRSQSSDKCFYCPIASGCAWCTGYNYQIFGTCNKRATFNCEMHKAAALAASYFWNTLAKKHDNDSDINGQRVHLYVPKNWAVPIIGEDEYVMLLDLAKMNEPDPDYCVEEG